jgi:NADH-quinone oxidoreductase subunit M
MFVEFLLAATLASALLVFMAPDRIAGKLAAALSLLPLGGTALMWSQYDARGNALLADGGTIAFESKFAWFELGGYTLQWHVGVDGVSFPLVVLTTILTTLAIVSSWTPIDERQSQFYGLMLIVETSLIGVFTGLDFFVWFIFWEGVLIPMYLLIAVWGGPRREYAAIKFLVYTNLASLLMFVGIFMLVFGLGDSLDTLSLVDITQAIHNGEMGSFAGLDPGWVQGVAFVLLFLGFAVKVPVVPFHTWLPDAHVEAPTPVSIMLAGVLLKMGTYALLRFNFTMLEDVVREAPNAPEILTIIGVISVIYGAMLALAQQDLKRIVAYSSISSMGYVLVGLAAMTPHGVGGATFQMVSHGLISGLLFMAVGVIYNATHTRMVGDMSGLADRMPWTAGVFVAGAFGYMGLPLMSGFAAEVLVFIGAFDSHVTGSPVLTALAMFGIVVVAGYLLWAMQRTLFGPFELETDYEIGRAPVHDIASLVVLLGLVILLGVHPDFIYGAVQDAVRPFVDPTVDSTSVLVNDMVSVLGGEL